MKADREASGAKNCEEHVTVLICTNESGSFQLLSLVIGKSMKPCAQKNYDFQLSSVVCKNQKSAWMDVQLFQDCFSEEFVLCVKKFLRKSGLPERALLLVYNAPSHHCNVKAS